MSSDRVTDILAAAYACFSRHGVRRTTMDDIAREAGMSRAAVYQYVRNKDDAFRRLAASLFDAALAEARIAAAAEDDRAYRILAVKLELTLRLWRDSPAHAAEMLDASTKLTGDLVDDFTRSLTAVLEDVVGDRVVAEIAVALTRGLEADLTDHDITRQRLRDGVALLMAGLHSREAHP